MEIRIVNPLTDHIWEDLFYQTHKAMPIFYSAIWAKVLSKSYGYRPLYFTLFQKNSIEAAIPVMEVNSALTGKRGVALPFTDFCEPQVKSKEDCQILLDHILSYGKLNNWKYFELRGGNSCLSLKNSFETYIEHQIDLKKHLDDIYKNIRSSFKRNIKKSVKHEVRIEISQSKKALNDFINLNFLTRKRHGLPPQPSSFFKNLHRFCLKNHGYIFIGTVEKKVIAGAIFLIHHGNVIYKYGASDIDYQSLRPNNQLMWEAIQFFKKKNCSSISFGRTHPEHTGLLQFKNGLTKDTRAINYYRYDFTKNGFMDLKKHTGEKQINKIFNKMPIPILNLTGRLLYRHMG